MLQTSLIIICYLVGILMGNLPWLSLNRELLEYGSMADFSELLEPSSALFWFCGFVVLGSILLHFLLAMLFGVDRDILIISSTAAIYGAPFIAPVAQATGNRNLITVGISLSLIGYAMGNFLGISLAIVLN